DWREVVDIYPLSPMQQGMLFHSLYAPDSGVYLEVFHCTLQGHLDLPTFCQAWQQVIDGHEIFRTAFRWGDLEVPLQIVRQQVELPFTYHDWQDTDAPQLADFLARLQQTGLDLATAPLMQLHLIQLTPTQYHFVWIHHHILLDGWSLSTVLQQVFANYERSIEGLPALVTPTPAYQTYIAWLQQQDLSQAAGFWQQELQGFTTPTPLPSTKTDNVGSSEVELLLSPDLTQQLESFARSNHLTASNLVQGAWGMLLSRYSGDREVLFGVTFSGRPPTLAGVESMVGLFINTLPMRMDVAGELEIVPWLQTLQAKQLAASQYTYSPLVDIQRWSDLPSGVQLFNSLVVFENYPVSSALQQPVSSLEITDVRGSEQTNYPLTLIAIPGSQLSLKINYDRSLFEHETVLRMLGHLEVLLAGAIDPTATTIGELPLLTSVEMQQLLTEWNQPSVPYPQQCFHEIFSNHAARTPDAIAVVADERQLTYAELDARANRLAHYLQSLGVGPEIIVGLCVERSIAAIVGILGILKAGGAYVPLDPAYPKARLDYIATDAQIAMLLSQTDLQAQIPTVDTVVWLDRDWPTIEQSSSVAPTLDRSDDLDRLAYVIYTSGSTGQPKGVMVTHRGLGNLVAVQQELLQVTPQSKVVQFASLSFDASVWEICMALGNGATLYLGSRDTLLPGADLQQFLQTHSITHALLPPSALAVMPQNDFPHLQHLVVGGEACPAPLIDRWAPGRHFYNAYGPTEATVVGTIAICQPQMGQPPIGRPLTNTTAYILDGQQRLMPAGIGGEIYLGGVNLARGYLNRSELTAEKFIDHPWIPGARLYRTGDWGRYRTDGQIEYLGRIDHQVKIRGFRIELGEIEAVLVQHPDILQVVAIARTLESGRQQLVAYLVGQPAAQSHPPSIGDLRAFMSSRLPDYMVPAAFVFIPELPITPNGKVDKAALPDPDLSEALSADYVAPQSEIEDRLAQIWAEVLGLPQVGIRDNFFELGGDSILSLQIVARAHQLGWQLTPKQLFTHQSIAELATVVGFGTGIQAAQTPVVGEVPLTPIQHWFFAQDLPRPHHFNQSVLLAVPSDIEPVVLEQALQHLVFHHDALRLQFIPNAGSWQQYNAPPDAQVQLQIEDLSALPAGDRLQAIADRGTLLQASLDLGAGLLLAASLFKMGEGSDRLLIVIHHLAVDGVSWRILMSDLQTAYQQGLAGQTLQLPPKTTSFQYWAQQLSNYSHTADLQAARDYWQSLPVVPSLPIDGTLQSTTHTVEQAEAIAVSLDAATTQVLLQTVPTAYQTKIHEVLLTAVVLAFQQWTGRSSLYLDLEGHGREELFADVDLSRTVGWFTTMFPVQLVLPALDLGTALIAVKEQVRQVPDGGMSYGLLRYLNPSMGGLGDVPAAQVSFNYLGQFSQETSADEGWQLTADSGGDEQSLQAARSHLVEVNAVILAGELQVNWTYSPQVHLPATIDKLAADFLAALRSLISHCQAPDAGAYSPTDFPEADLDGDELAAILDDFSTL
ncbi:non-ribosomal peptide synthetase, partial [Chamaesiphon polymorphus]